MGLNCSFLIKFSFSLYFLKVSDSVEGSLFLNIPKNQLTALSPNGVFSEFKFASSSAFFLPLPQLSFSPLLLPSVLPLPQLSFSPLLLPLVLPLPQLSFSPLLLPLVCLFFSFLFSASSSAFFLPLLLPSSCLFFCLLSCLFFCLQSCLFLCL